MDLGLAERVAIVGGAGLEIGKQVAMTLASEGVQRSAICARATKKGLRRAEMEVARVGTQHNVLAMPADLSEPRDIRREWFATQSTASDSLTSWWSAPANVGPTVPCPTLTTMRVTEEVEKTPAQRRPA